jgi:hypothetical protein
MTTKTEIGNVALKAMGEKRVDSLDQDTKPARSLKTVYNVCRRAVLRDHPWNFAKTETTLAASAPTSGWKWGYEHPIPSDFLRLADVKWLGGRYELKRVRGVGRVIACDSTPIQIEYIADVTVEAEFDAAFVDAFALKLASRTALDITGSATVAQELEGAYEKQLRRAKGVDAMENGQDEIEDGGGWNGARN